MGKSTVGLLAVGIAVLCASSWAMADAAGDYQALFGEEEKTAARSAKSSVEFAAKLLNAPKSVAAQKELQALLCEKAYEFGMKAPAGWQGAAEAMTLLIGGAPDKKAEPREKLLKVTELRYARSTKDERKQLGEELVGLLGAMGDERAEAKQADEAVVLYRRALALATTVQSDRTQGITEKIKELAAAQKAERRLADLKARFKTNPNAANRTSLILAYLGELDDPNEAAKLVTADVNEGLRTYVPLAAKKVEDLSASACLDLAEWYVAIADKVSGAGKGVLLGKAQGCCERYLELHPTEDASRLKGKMLLAKVDKAFETAGGSGRQIALTLAKGVTLKLVRIPAGKFIMGSRVTEAGRERREGPQREVTISRAFYMGMYEVTQAQYEAVMGKNPSKSKAADSPVENVSWDDAVEFCKKLSGEARKTVRLPTEAEWEYAVRAGTKTAYFFGDDERKLGDYAWFEGNADRKTHPVRQKKPNPAGLYDMYGNVWEWCSDWYADSYLPAGPAGAKARTVDPHGPDSGAVRVLRGGSWWDPSKSCRSALRAWNHPDGRVDGLGGRGFRVVVAAGGVD